MIVRNASARVILAIAALVLNSCASTELTNSWRSPDYKGGALKKIVVIGVSKQAALRRTFEDEFVKQLKASGVDAITSYTLIPQVAEADGARLKEAAGRSGADGMLVTRLVRAGADAQFTPAFRPTPGSSFTAGYSAAWTGYHEPAVAPEPETVVLETNLYGGGDESVLLWSGTTQTFAPSGELQKDIQEFVKLVIERLRKEKLI